MLIRPSDQPQSESRPPPQALAQHWAEIEPLCVLCEEGRLYEVEKWISEGKPIQCVRPTEKEFQKRKTPLQWAVDRGFHSLAELLLINGYDPNGDFCECLSPAVRSKNHSMVELLLRYGADPLGVDFEEVLETYDRSLMDCFVAAGVDPCHENAVARALRHKGRPLLGFVKTYKERFPGLVRQASIALRVFAEEGDPKGVALMLWLGADPYQKVPKSDWPCDSDDEECALDTCRGEKKDVIIQQLLKVPIPLDRVQDLFRSTAFDGHPGITRKLLALGADPNDQPEGRHVLHDFVFAATWRYAESLYPGREKQALEAIRLVAEAGAKWDLDNKGLAELRRRLLDGKSSIVIALLEILGTHRVFSEEQLYELTRTDGMKRMLNGYTRPHRDPFEHLYRPAAYTPVATPGPVAAAPRRGYWKQHWSKR